MPFVTIGMSTKEDVSPPMATGEATANAATTEVNMTYGLAEVNNYLQNRVEESRTLEMLATTAAQNSTITDNYKRRMSRFSLDERLQDWMITMAVRNDNKRIDKFYIHLLSNLQLRSLNEVDDFVHHGYHPKRPQKGANPVDNSVEPGTSSGKRSTRRKLDWEFRFKGKSYNGEFVLYDIHFLDPGSNQDSKSSRGFRVNEEILFSTGGMISDLENKHRRKRRKKIESLDTTEITLNESVEVFMYEAYQNLVNKDMDDKGKCSKKGKRMKIKDGMRN